MNELITIAVAAERLDISPRWLAKLCQEGRVPGAQKPGRDWLVPVGAKIEPTGLGRPLRTLEIPRSPARSTPGQAQHSGAGPKDTTRKKR